MKERKTLKRKSWSYWHSFERGMCCCPFVWHNLRGNSVPLADAIVLITTWGHEGKILRTPKGDIGNTFAFLGKHNTRWWSYLPPLPAIRDSSGKVLTVEDFFHYAVWSVDAKGDRLRSEKVCGNSRRPIKKQ